MKIDRYRNMNKNNLAPKLSPEEVKTMINSLPKLPDTYWEGKGLPDEPLKDINFDGNAKEQKVFNLTVELADVLNKRKSMMKGFNEEKKRLQAEIKELIKGNLDTHDV